MSETRTPKEMPETRTAYSNVSESVQILNSLVYRGTGEVKRFGSPIAYVVESLLIPCLKAWDEEMKAEEPAPENAIELVPEIVLDDQEEEEEVSEDGENKQTEQDADS